MHLPFRSPLSPSLLLAMALSLTIAGCTDDPTATAVDGIQMAKGGGKGPTVDATDPTGAPQGTTLDVRVLGNGFEEGSDVKLVLEGDETMVQTDSVRFVGRRELVATITIGSEANIALYDVQVIGPGGKKGIGTELFAVQKKDPDDDPRLLWEVATRGWVYGGPALDNGTLYFASNSDRFYAVGVDGQVRWTLRADISLGSHEPPVVKDRIVYFTSLRQLFAVDAVSGVVLWSRTLGLQRKGKKSSNPYLAGLNVSTKWIHVGNSDGYLFALNRTTGATVDSVLVGPNQRVVGQPTFVGERLYVAGRMWPRGVVHSFVVGADGSLTHQKTSAEVGNIGTSLVHDGANTLYFSSRDGNFYAMDLGDLSLRSVRSVQIDLDGSQAASSPAIGEDGTIYVASYDTCFPVGGGTTANACLYALNPDLSVLWTAPVGTTVWKSSPAVGADGTIYIGNSDNRLVAISSSGKQLWTFQAAHWVHGSPTISGTTLFVGSDDGSMYALQTEDLVGGLADSPWPKLRADEANSGVARLPIN